MTNDPLLRVDGLSVSLFTRAGVMQAVDNLSFDLRAGETLAIVGESGCGKSLTALALMRLLPTPPARIVAGRIDLGGLDLATLPEARMRKVRGREIGMIFQDPLGALDPVMSIGRQLTEAICAHTPLSRRDAETRAVELLDRVSVPDARRRLDEYPHMLSGGMRQRVMIAMAIACSPKVLIADEPTTALDVTVQAQVIELLKELQQSLGTALILITHDLGVVAEIADRVLVMYAGRPVEQGPAADLFEDPQHPYTRGLLSSTLGLGRRHGDFLPEIGGTVPSLAELPPGCAFSNRCSEVRDICLTSPPPLRSLSPSRSAACFVAEEDARRVATQRS
ncbi:peptide ABC transporter ATP-binding protein [Rhodopseudomonas sp. AAP120]|uniref:ABC transporter ATP-binding protein n=1 Tax=Rhodopseudomonas sp. AAP120 TaxID=1523430 RepID=UPI0006B8D7D7|nr:ABC transporter ATP-binding protein [Rhodopseudomonas sp. AAP120]KPG01966.1 peptide ABC transporter ATP-binding protein [Rhodopseudomonas sp. AAP120]